MNKIITIFKTIYKIWEYKITEDYDSEFGNTLKVGYWW